MLLPLNALRPRSHIADPGEALASGHSMTGSIPSVAVAVVDDDDSVLKAIGRLLSAAGFDARAFHSGREFLDALAADGIGCVLLDIRMPNLDGFAVARLLAEQALRIPIIFMSAHDSDSNRRRAVELGATAFLQKPSSEKTILAAVRQALDLANPST